MMQLLYMSKLENQRVGGGGEGALPYVGGTGMCPSGCTF